MNRFNLHASIILCLACVVAVSARGQSPTTNRTEAISPEALFKRVSPSLVAVKYQWEDEFEKHELVGSGIVIRNDGLIIIPLVMVADFIPDKQMKEFKVIVPTDGDDEELDATFIGRDDRSNLGFVQVSPTANRTWQAIEFHNEPVQVGQPLYGVGMLPKGAGYRTYLTQATVSAILRGELPQILVNGGLCGVGSPVFDASGNAIGIVGPQEREESLLENNNELSTLVQPPKLFVPASDFIDSVQHPMTADHPSEVPWSGITQMTGVNKQLGDFLGLKNQPSAQVGAIADGGPAAKAGLEAGNIIVKVNGQPLRRGDQPEEIPQILRRDIMRMKVGDTVTFTVLPEQGKPLKEVQVQLEKRPDQPSQADRFFAKDLGFVAREAVFFDNYTHKVKNLQSPGVVVANLRRDGAAATAKLAVEDLILQVNGQKVADLSDFKKAYQAFRTDHAKEALVLVVHRPQGHEETINIEPPQGDASSIPGPGAGQ